MSFRIISFLLSLVFLISILTFSSHAQFVSSEIYETEEDLREGLELGLLTFDQYLELQDLIQAQVTPSSEEVDKLFFVPDVSLGDISQIQDEKQVENPPTWREENILIKERTDSFLSESKKRETSLSGKFVWRFYEEFQDAGKNDNYLSVEIANKNNLVWRMEAEEKSDQDLRIRKRSLKFSYPQYSTQAIVGNFDKKIGLGLNVGYHPHFAYSSSSDPKPKDSFLYPILGRYNGICVESKFDFFSLLAFYSQNKREKIKDRITAFDLNFVNKKIKLGLCVSEGKLENIENQNSFQDDCKSLHFDFKLKSIKLSGEYALLSNQKSAQAMNFISLGKPYRIDFSWWSYDHGFVHPFGGGLSNPDYETIYLEKMDYQYQSRQAGERGVFFKSEYRLFHKLNLNFSYTQWEEAKTLPQKMKFKLGWGYAFTKSFSFLISHLWTDYDLGVKGIDRKVSSLNLFFSPRSNFDLRFITNYKTEENKNYGDFQLRVKTQLIYPLGFTLWLKYNDSNFSKSSDGYFSFHVQEKIQFFKNYSVSAEYISKFYQDENKDDTKTARIRLEALW